MGRRRGTREPAPWARIATLFVAVGGLAACSGSSPTASPAGAWLSLPSVALPSAAVSASPADASIAAPPADLDGGLIKFSRFDEASHTFISEHLISPTGTGETQLPLPSMEGGGGWSRDGTRIATAAFLEDGRVGTAIIRPDGTVVAVLPLPDPTLNLVCTVWSPDDERLACEGFNDDEPTQTGLYTVRSSDGGDLIQLTTPPAGMNDIPGDFTPDGRQVVFTRTTGEEAAPLMLVEVEGGDPLPISKATYEDPGRYSPDGGRLLTSADGRLVMLDLDGNVLGTIEEPGQYLFGPDWSPSGGWIAYSRTATGTARADVFVSRADGSDAWQVTTTPANEINADWGSDSG
jgi:hypothetical protein